MQVPALLSALSAEFYGEVSDRQWRDILGIIRIQGSGLDRDYLRSNAPALQVTDLLDRALNEAG